jgi:hypothetical protein
MALESKEALASRWGVSRWLCTLSSWVPWPTRLAYNCRPGIRPDKNGRRFLSALIPGAAYRLHYESPSGANAVLDFTAESGKTLELPDVVKKLADGRAE